MVTAAIAREAAFDAPGAANKKMIDLRMWPTGGPGASAHERTPTGQDQAQQRPPTVEVAAEQHRQRGIEQGDNLVDPPVLAKRAVAEVRAVHRDDEERSFSVAETRNDEGSVHLLTREPSERLHSDLLDGEAGEQGETPRAMFDVLELAAPSALDLREGSMFVEVETVLAGEMGEQWLPAPRTTARRDPHTRRQRRKESFNPEALAQLVEEVVPVLAAPEFGQDQDVGVQRRDVVEDLRRAAPSIDAGVKVKRRDTHTETLRRRHVGCGRL